MVFTKAQLGISNGTDDSSIQIRSASYKIQNLAR
jgi:hypothetical protein